MLLYFIVRKWLKIKPKQANGDYYFSLGLKFKLFLFTLCHMTFKRFRFPLFLPSFQAVQKLTQITRPSQCTQWSCPGVEVISPNSNVFRSPLEYWTESQLFRSPFEKQTIFDHLNTGQDHYSDPHCRQNCDLRLVRVFNWASIGKPGKRFPNVLYWFVLTLNW